MKAFPACVYFTLFCSVSDDIGTELVSLELLSARNVSNFVPRLGDNKGLLPVKLKLSGKDGLPAAAAIQVRSYAAVSNAWSKVPAHTRYVEQDSLLCCAVGSVLGVRC